MRELPFLIACFFGGAAADVLLRDLDRPRFRPYFASRGIVEAAFLGGVTVAVVVALTSLFVSHHQRVTYVILLLIMSWLVSWFYQYFEPFGPELRPHTRSEDGRMLDLLTALGFIGVMFVVEDFVLPHFCGPSTLTNGNFEVLLTRSPQLST